MDAIVTAGGRLKTDDPLYLQMGFEKKALLPLLGQPMIDWVLDALRGSDLVDSVAIVGLDPDELARDDDQLHFVPSVGGLVENILAGLAKLQEINPAVEQFLLVSSDIPLITAEIVREFVAECSDPEANMYYAVVGESVMEATFPDSKRTFVPFKDGRFSGGDILLVKVEAVENGNIDLARAITSSRKNYLEQARLLGFGFIIKFVLRMMTLQEAAKQASGRAGLRGRAVLTRFAELGMDVDKINQYELIKSYLERRQVSDD